MGVSEEKFNDSAPVDLEPYIEAYKLQQKQMDAYFWAANRYTLLATSIAIQRSFLGKKSKSEYPEKPFSVEEYVSEEQKEQERKMLLANLQVKKALFEKNKKNENDQMT